MGGDQEDHAVGAPRAEVTLDLEFRDLTPETARDLFAFFAGPAFADFPHWRDCNCLFYNFSGGDDEWQSLSGEQTRAAKLALIESGRSNGVLAYSGGEVVGWCHADRRSHLPKLGEDALGAEAERMGAIVCFVVAPSARRQGVATALTRAALDRLSRLGLEAVDAYPPIDPESGPVPLQQAMYHGPRSMYLGAGFEEVGRQGAFAVMRRPLR